MTTTKESALGIDREYLASLEPLPTLEELVRPFEEAPDLLASSFGERTDALAHAAYIAPDEYWAEAVAARQLFRDLSDQVSLLARNRTLQNHGQLQGRCGDADGGRGRVER